METRVMSQVLVRAACLLLCAAVAVPAQDAPRPLKAGIIGCDTSHVIAFTKAINAPGATGDVAALTVVAAWPGGTDIPASKNRVKGFTEQLRRMGVVIVDSIPALLEKVDVVLLESVDGRPHLEQARPVFAAKKPVFIDKPLAGSLADAIAIRALADKHGVPWFSSSSLRFSPGFLEARSGKSKIGPVRGCSTWGPCTLEPTHPDLFWYGVHGVEALFAIMGPGCERVTRVHTDGTDVVVGTWKDGRIGTFRGIRDGQRGYGVTVFGKNGVERGLSYTGYAPFIDQLARFFQTGKPPVDADETIEMFAFMEAADESKRQGGVPVTLESVMRKARNQ